MKIRRIHIFLISFAVAFILYYVLTSGVNTNTTKILNTKDYNKEIENLEVFEGSLSDTNYSERIRELYYIGNDNFIVSFADGYRVISKDGEVLTGGDILYNVTYPEYSHFLATKNPNDSMFAVFDSEGKKITDYIYDQDTWFVDDNIGIVFKDNKSGVINGKGEIVLPIEYDSNVYCDIEDGRILLTTLDTRENILYDFNFNALTTIKADVILDLKDGMIRAIVDDKECWLNYEGDVLFDAEDYAWSSFFGKYAMKYDEDNYYIVDNKGEIVVDFNEDFDLDLITEIEDPSENGTMIVAQEDYYALYDLNTKEYITDFDYEYINTFSKEGYAVASKNGMYGMIDDKGNTILDFKYDVVEDYSKDGIPVLKDDLWYVIDENGKPLSKFKYDVEYMEPVQGDYVECSVGDYVGILSLKDGDFLLGDLSPRKGKVYTYDNESSKNLIVVETNDHDFGVIDKSGNVIIPFEYLDMQILGDNCFSVSDINGDSYLINSENEIIQEFDSPVFFEKDPDGKHYKFTNEDELVGFVDNEGNVVIEPKYLDIGPYGDIMAVVLDDTDEEYLDSYAFINNKGEIIGNKKFYMTENFSNGRGLVANEDFDFGYVDEKGDLVIDYKFVEGGDFTEAGITWVEKEYGVFAIIDKNGNIVKDDIEADFMQNTPYPNRFTITIDEKTGLVNEKGEYVIEPIYDLVEFSTLTREQDSTSLDYIIVSKDGYEGLVDINGNTIVEPKFEYVSYFTNDLAKVGVNGYYGFVNTKGEMAIEPIYVLASYFNSDAAIAYTVYDGLNLEGYIIDKAGNKVKDISNYKNIYPFHNGTCVAEEEEDTYLLDTSGNVIYPKENNNN